MFRKYSLPLLLLTFLCTGASAQERVAQVFGPEFYEDFNDADIAAGGNGWAVGDCGLYLKTTDGGATWSDVSDRFDENTSYISCLPGTNCQTVFRTQNQGITASFDGGQNWETVLETSWAGKFDYSVPGTIFSWRDGRSEIVKSTDGGRNWTVIPAGNAPVKTDLLVTSANEFGYFNGMQYIRTSDGGQTFVTGDTLDQPAAVVTVANNGDYYAVDRFTKLWRSTDRGVNWTLHNDDIYQYTVHHGLWMDEDDVLHYLSFLGNHVVSSDGGLSWEKISNGPRLWSANNFKRTENGHIAIGNGNSLHKYDGANDTYEYLLGDVHPNFQTMDFSPDGTAAYAATRDGLIYKSVNGGADWTYTNTTIPGDPINIIARSASDVLYLGQNSRLLSSNDGGTTFTNVDLGATLNNFGFGSIERAGNDEFFIMDVNTFARITADGDIIYENDVTGGGVDLHFIDDDKGFRFGRQSLLRTLDGGRTWTEPTIEGNLGFRNSAIHFVNDAYGILLGSTVFETRDGGATWTTLPDFPRGDAFATNQAEDTVYVNMGSEILQSPNQETMEFAFVADLECGSARDLMRRPGSPELFALETSGIAVINPHVTEIVDGLWVAPPTEPLRAFPNPTTGLVQLDVPGLRAQPALIEVFSLNGQLVETAEFMVADGRLDLSGMVSGIYVVRVTGRGKVWSGRVVVR